MQLIENEIFKFEEQICDFEEDLSNEANDIADEVRDHILAAIGKAKLLMSQKLTQFRGLCDKNIVSTISRFLSLPSAVPDLNFSFAAFKSRRGPICTDFGRLGRILGHGLHSSGAYSFPFCWADGNPQKWLETTWGNF